MRSPWGYRVMRFHNARVLSDVESVVAEIAAALRERMQASPPGPLS